MATLAATQATLVLWETARDVAASGKSYAIGDRTFTRHNVDELNDMINTLRGEIAALQATAAGSNSRASLACWNQCT